MTKRLTETLKRINLPDEALAERVRKQVGGKFGLVGEIAARYASIVGEERPAAPRHCMVIAAADHGVARHGISAYPVETTMHMTANYLVSKGASANAFANFCGADMVVVDVGVAGDMTQVPGLRRAKIAWGTQDFSEGPAMTRAQAISALEEGIAIVDEQVRAGYTCFSLGEMGIGNTTCSAAIVAAFLGLNAATVTGRGTGISDGRLRVKLDLVQRAIDCNKPDPCDGLDVLSKVGGFEIGALAGVVLGCAANGCAVVLDGLNTTAAALIAQAIDPRCRSYMFSSHLSGEPAHVLALRHLQLDACVNMGVRLGEAIGASVVMDWLTLSTALLTMQPDVAAAKRISEQEFNKESTVRDIRPLDETAMAACQRRLDNLTKPLNSLHSFEHLARQLAGITGRARPQRLKRTLLLFNAGDNTEDVKVAQRFAGHVGADVLVCDFTCAAAGQSARTAFARGVALAETALGDGQILAVDAIGRDEAAMVVAACAETQNVDRLMDLLDARGALLTAKMAGAVVGAAAAGNAVVIDGAQAIAAALLAVRLAPHSRNYLIGAQQPSDERQRAMLEQLELPTYLRLNLRAAGCGAVLAIALLDASLHMLNDMKTFGDAQVAVAEDGPGALKQDPAVREDA